MEASDDPFLSYLKGVASEYKRQSITGAMPEELENQTRMTERASMLKDAFLSEDNMSDVSKFVGELDMRMTASEIARTELAASVDLMKKELQELKEANKAVSLDL